MTNFFKIILKVCLPVIFLVLTFQTSYAQQICDNQVGTHDGFTYEYWKDSGSGCMTLGSGGTFEVDWSGINNLLARTGMRPGSMNQVVTYEADYQPNGNSYLCIYGWTTNPLVEYYIVESYGSWKPPGATAKGTIDVDGGTYEIFETTRTNQPSIEGTATFQQYWSVRTEKRTSGTVHVGEHFDAWQGMGMNMGSLYEVSMTVEGYQSSGYANVHSLSMTEGDYSGDTDSGDSDSGDTDSGDTDSGDTDWGTDWNTDWGTGWNTDWGTDWGTDEGTEEYTEEGPEEYTEEGTEEFTEEETEEFTEEETEEFTEEETEEYTEEETQDDGYDGGDTESNTQDGDDYSTDNGINPGCGSTDSGTDWGAGCDSANFGTDWGTGCAGQ
ncbi:MAG: glycoside hydrolase family 11 protein [Desulfobacteraceae bacterium]|jgi:hypothetical protein